MYAGNEGISPNNIITRTRVRTNSEKARARADVQSKLAAAKALTVRFKQMKAADKEKTAFRPAQESADDKP